MWHLPTRKRPKSQGDSNAQAVQYRAPVRAHRHRHVGSVLHYTTWKPIVATIDYFSKWIEAKPILDCTAITTARFILDEIVLRHGVQRFILTDQGSNLESKLIQKLAKLLGIEKRHSSPYHAMGNGMIERENKSLKSALRAFVFKEQTNWDKWIRSIVFAINTTVHATTKYSPFEIIRGYLETSVSDWQRGTVTKLGNQADPRMRKTAATPRSSQPNSWARFESLRS